MSDSILSAPYFHDEEAAYIIGFLWPVLAAIIIWIFLYYWH